MTDEQNIHNQAQAKAYLATFRTTGKMRRLARRFCAVVTPHTPQPIPEAVKILHKCAKLPMIKLGRRLKQAARRAATAKNLLARLYEGSPFRPSLQAEQDKQLFICKQINAEIMVRNFRAQPEN